MKRLLLIGGLFFAGLSASLAVDPASLDQTPLPAGRLINRAPDFAKWEITFSYPKDNKASGTTSTTPPPVPGAVNIGRPQSLIITQTRPLWHGVLIDEFKNKTDAWYDGAVPYITGPLQTKAVVMYMNTPGLQMPKFLNYRGNDFPDVDWVSAQTYLGTEKVTSYWVFQNGPTGPTLWINSTTRYPVRWQSGPETRTFRFLDPPDGLLELPPDIAQLSKQQAFIRGVASHTIPKGG
jgi:hypothetical protein